MADVETIHLRGEGGMVIAHDLPLHETAAQQLVRGELVRVNPDGSAYEAHGAMDLVKGEVRVPGANAPKNEWVGYAVSKGMTVSDADALTKTDLIERFGVKK